MGETGRDDEDGGVPEEALDEEDIGVCARGVKRMVSFLSAGSEQGERGGLGNHCRENLARDMCL